MSFFLIVFKLSWACSNSRDTLSGRVLESTRPCLIGNPIKTQSDHKKKHLKCEPTDRAIKGMEVTSQNGSN